MTRVEAHDIDTLANAAHNLRQTQPSNVPLDRPKVNLHGILCMGVQGGGERTAYGQLYRNGSIELADGALPRPRFSNEHADQREVVYPCLMRCH
ncbi:protein of unknown function (plasmid) [Pararobbsia alpina]